MRSLLRAFAILAITSVSFMTTFPAAAQSSRRLDAGADYDFLHTNAPPGSCPCFSASGGDAWAGYMFSSGLSIVGEVASQHASNIGGSGEDLTLTSFLAGPRYSYLHIKRVVPFGELLLGAAHADGSLSPENSGINGSSNAFAMVAGSGLDVPVTKRISIRAVRADYYLTRFANGVNDHQNNLRISAGIVVRIR